KVAEIAWMNLHVSPVRGYLSQHSDFMRVLFDEVVFMKARFDLECSQGSSRNQLVRFGIDSNTGTGKGVYVNESAQNLLPSENRGIRGRILLNNFVLDL